MSRSTTSPVSGHTRCLSILPLPIRRDGVPSGVAQPWWIWLEANQRSATVRLPPWRAVLLDQLRPNQSHRSIRDGPAKRSPAHALCHGGHVEILDHDAAVGARQLGGEPVAASRLRCTHRRSRRTSLAFAWRHPREPGMRRESSRPARRRAVSVTLSGAGFGYPVSVSTPVVGSMVATVAKVRTPRSRPAVIDGAHGCGCA